MGMACCSESPQLPEAPAPGDPGLGALRRAPHGSTPEAVLEEFNAAVAKADGAALLECLSPEQREHVPIMGARAARFILMLCSDQNKGVVKELDALDAIVRGRGVSANYAMAPKPQEFLRIRDRAAFVGELLRFTAKHRLVERYVAVGGTLIVEGMLDAGIPHPLLPAQWKLGPWGVPKEGDRVQGSARARIGNVNASVTAYFQRVEGRWYLVIPPVIIRELGRGK